MGKTIKSISLLVLVGLLITFIWSMKDKHGFVEIVFNDITIRLIDCGKPFFKEKRGDEFLHVKTDKTSLLIKHGMLYVNRLKYGEINKPEELIIYGDGRIIGDDTALKGTPLTQEDLEVAYPLKTHRFKLSGYNAYVETRNPFYVETPRNQKFPKYDKDAGVLLKADGKSLEIKGNKLYVNGEVYPVILNKNSEVCLIEGAIKIKQGGKQER